jgi:hypothetical protein
VPNFAKFINQINKKQIQTQNIQLGQKGSMSNADLDVDQQNPNLPSGDGELNFDPVDGELDSVE